MLLIAGAFTVLLISGVSAVIVLPPTNVNVGCQNLKVTVSWEYSDQQPQTSFRVDIRGAAGHSVKETTDHEYDLTGFIWASEERYMDIFYVTITAIQGSNQSEPVQSKTFTFNNVKTADVTCQLDFPPVDLNVKDPDPLDVDVKDSGATVSFRNPFHFYRELKRASKSDTASFGFSVNSENGDKRFSCAVREENCQRDIVLLEGVECVMLDGVLFDGIGVGQVSFRETDRVCISKGTEVHVILLITLLSITALIITVILIFVCKERAHTMKTSLPPSLQPPTRESDLQYTAVSDTDVSAVRVTVEQPCKNPSVSSEEENHPTESLHDSSASLYVDRALSESSDQELEAAGSIAEGHGTDDDSANESVKTECVFVDSEEEERSPYDRPHVQLDMGDGDMVTGYTGR